METNNLASKRENQKEVGWELHFLVPTKDCQMFEPAHAICNGPKTWRVKFGK